MDGPPAIGPNPDHRAGLIWLDNQPHYPTPAPNQSPSHTHSLRSYPMATLRRPYCFSYFILFLFYFFFCLPSFSVIHKRDPSCWLYFSLFIFFLFSFLYFPFRSWCFSSSPSSYRAGRILSILHPLEKGIGKKKFQCCLELEERRVESFAI
jgi:hypothetical protein